MNSKINNIYLGQAIGDALGLATESSEQGLKVIIVEGGDEDTNGCIAGPLIGAKFEKIPSSWIDGLKKKNFNFG